LFRCKGAAATLADSLYLEGSDRPIKTQQIVLSTGVEAPLEASETIINWTFRRLDSHN
jgi:uncharacterized heparinase superfamily protein